MKTMPHLVLLLTLALAVDPAPAQQAGDAGAAKHGGIEHRLAQKIRMVRHILNSPDLQRRVEASGDPVAARLLERAGRNFREGEDYFGGGRLLEADAILDYVIRDLGASARLLNETEQKKDKYLKFRYQLEAFVLPEWENLGDAQTDYLQARLELVSELSRGAAIEAEGGNFDAAAELLERAYAVKAELLQRLQHEKTIVYSLDFDSVQDEYRYLAGRTYHYLDLVNLAMSEQEVEARTRELVDGFIYRSMIDLEAAEARQSEGDFSAANRLLENSIAQLESVLKILGIGI